MIIRVVFMSGKSVHKKSTISNSAFWRYSEERIIFWILNFFVRHYWNDSQPFGNFFRCWLSALPYGFDVAAPLPHGSCDFHVQAPIDS